MAVLGLIIFILFLVINFFLTQKIYDSNKIAYSALIALITSIILSFLIKTEGHDFIERLNLCLVFFYYLIILLFIKISYKKILAVLSKKKYGTNNISSKDFIYVLWVSDAGGEHYWDNKIQNKPNWLDEILSLMLIIIPIIICVFVNIAIT